MVLATTLGVIFLLAYAASLWWLLRRESPEALLAVAVVCALSLSLRLIHTYDYPRGLDEHESRHLEGYVHEYAAGNPFGVTHNMPVFMNGALSVPLVPVFGVRWAARMAPLVGGVLSSAAAFAAARALGLRVGPGLTAAALLAVLPWSMFYSRLSLGAEMFFHQLLLIAALSRLLFASGGVPEVLIGALGLGFLLYDYHAGRVMLGLPLAAAILAPRGRRLLCLAVLVLGAATYIPYFVYSGHATYAWVALKPTAADSIYHQGLATDPLATLLSKTEASLRVLAQPVGIDAFFAIRAGAMNPLPVLAVAALGVLVGLRRGLFLFAGFAGGLLPSILSEGNGASSHRVMMALPFIPLAAALAFDRLTRAAWGGLVAALFVAVVGAQSVLLYFSPDFWHPESRARFDWEKTELAEALPARGDGRVIVMQQLEYFGRVRLLNPAVEILSVENWYPNADEPTTYAFTQEAAPLAPFYSMLLGGQRVTGIGGAFLLRLEAADWSWMRRHGWTYRARCGDQTFAAQVPALYHWALEPGGLVCREPVVHTWSGRWNGSARLLRLRGYRAAVTVDGPRGRLVEGELPDHGYLEFDAEPDETLRIEARTPGAAVFIGLYEAVPSGLRIPAWESVSPVDDDGRPTA